MTYIKNIFNNIEKKYTEILLLEDNLILFNKHFNQNYKNSAILTLKKIIYYYYFIEKNFKFQNINLENETKKIYDSKFFDNELFINNENYVLTFFGILEDILNNKFSMGASYNILYKILTNILKINELKEINKDNKIKDNKLQKNYVITLTYGEVAENHVGMQKLGLMRKEGDGLNLEDLESAKYNFEKQGFECSIIDLVKEGKVENIRPTPQSAYVLLIKNGISALISEDFNLNSINKEVLKDTWDKKAFMKGRVVNKIARYNLNYADESQEPDYENKKGRVISFKDSPLVNKIRENLLLFFGKKANKLYAEGNFYYDLLQCGIGFHGDSERRIVIAVRLGDSSLPIHYQWFQNSKPIGERIIINLNPGDVYAMSEIAVGTNWKKKIIPTLRHATGCKKYLVINK